MFSIMFLLQHRHFQPLWIKTQELISVMLPFPFEYIHFGSYLKETQADHTIPILIQSLEGV